MTGLRSLLFLVAYSFRRQLRSRKMLLAAILLALIAVVVVRFGVRATWSARRFGDLVVLKLLGLFFVPVVALMFGTGAIGDDRDERSLVYLVTRPMARSGIFAGKLLAVLPHVLVLNGGGLVLLWLLATVWGRPELEGALAHYLAPVLLSSLAYVAFFHCLAALFRHATLISIAYVFFVEVFLGSVPGILKRVSISFYTASMVYGSGAPLSPPPVFLPIDASTARWVLAGLAVGFLALGAAAFSRREQHDPV
ncbi:MAG: ABC transporter permease [Planctomycetes bacterium]|nr:ABC transporter permease [Planctomycetota bacterium]